jgi:hypothetical protein
MKDSLYQTICERQGEVIKSLEEALEAEHKYASNLAEWVEGLKGKNEVLEKHIAGLKVEMGELVELASKQKELIDLQEDFITRLTDGMDGVLESEEYEEAPSL